MRHKLDTEFIKQVAKDEGLSITDIEAQEAHDVVLHNLEFDPEEEYSYELRQYFRG